MVGHPSSAPTLAERAGGFTPTNSEKTASGRHQSKIRTSHCNYLRGHGAMRRKEEESVRVFGVGARAVFNVCFPSGDSYSHSQSDPTSSRTVLTPDLQSSKRLMNVPKIMQMQHLGCASGVHHNAVPPCEHRTKPAHRIQPRVFCFQLAATPTKELQAPLHCTAIRRPQPTALMLCSAT